MSQTKLLSAIVFGLSQGRLFLVLWTICVIIFAYFLVEAGKKEYSKILTFFYKLLPNLAYFIFLLRVPIVSGLIFFTFPLIAQFLAKDFLLNIFVIEKDLNLFLVTVLAAFTATIIYSQGKTIINLIDNGNDFIISPWETAIKDWNNPFLSLIAEFIIKIIKGINNFQNTHLNIIVIFLCLPIWFILGINQESYRWTICVIGALSSILILWLLQKIPKKQESQTEKQKKSFLNKFVFNILGLEVLVGIILYSLFIWKNWPTNNSWQSPTLLYLLLILGVLTLAIGFVVFIFDYSVDQRLDDQKQDDDKKIKPDKDKNLLNHTFYWPVIIFLVLFSALGYGAFGIDHYFELKDTKLTTKEEILKENQYREDFQQAIWNRLCNEPFESDKPQTCDNNQEKSLVVVSASGGGIQASGWMAQVLAGLQQELGEDFTKAIALISSTSGGSVGSMFYLNQFENKVLSNQALTTVENTSLTKVVKNSTDDWLNSVGWGLAFPDLFRGMGFPAVAALIKPDLKYLDRAYALEKSWEKTLSENEDKDKLTLDNYRLKVLDGEIPIPVYNTTLVENGSPFLVSPMKFVKGTMADYDQKLPVKDLPKALDFKTLYNNCGQNQNESCDLALTSAARLSASFPYVTPMARNDRENYIKDQNNKIMTIKDQEGKDIDFLQNYHIADGGFYDNAGGFTAAQWVNDILKYNNGLPVGDETANKASQKNYKNHHINLRKVLLLQINAFPIEKLKLAQQGTPGFKVVTIGPLNTLAGVRDSTQIARNATFINVLKDRWNNDKTEINNLDIADFAISFPALIEDKPSEPPLSWRLTKKQKENLVTAWETDQEIRENVKCMKIFWQDKIKEYQEKCDNIS